MNNSNGVSPEGERVCWVHRQRRGTLRGQDHRLRRNLNSNILVLHVLMLPTYKKGGLGCFFASTYITFTMRALQDKPFHHFGDAPSIAGPFLDAQLSLNTKLMRSYEGDTSVCSILQFLKKQQKNTNVNDDIRKQTAANSSRALPHQRPASQHLAHLLCIWKLPKAWRVRQRSSLASSYALPWPFSGQGQQTRTTVCATNHALERRRQQLASPRPGLPILSGSLTTSLPRLPSAARFAHPLTPPEAFKTSTPSLLFFLSSPFSGKNKNKKQKKVAPRTQEASNMLVRRHQGHNSRFGHHTVTSPSRNN